MSTITESAVDYDERRRLVKSSRKLEKVLGETPPSTLLVPNNPRQESRSLDAERPNANRRNINRLSLIDTARRSAVDISRSPTISHPMKIIPESKREELLLNEASASSSTLPSTSSSHHRSSSSLTKFRKPYTARVPVPPIDPEIESASEIKAKLAADTTTPSTPSEPFIVPPPRTDSLPPPCSRRPPLARKASTSSPLSPSPRPPLLRKASSISVHLWADISFTANSSSPEDSSAGTPSAEESEKRKRIARLSKLTRMLGENLPRDLVDGDSGATQSNSDSKSSLAPPSSSEDGLGLGSGNSSDNLLHPDPEQRIGRTQTFPLPHTNQRPKSREHKWVCQAKGKSYVEEDYNTIRSMLRTLK